MKAPELNERIPVRKPCVTESFVLSLLRLHLQCHYPLHEAKVLLDDWSMYCITETLEGFQRVVAFWMSLAVPQSSRKKDFLGAWISTPQT